MPSQQLGLFAKYWSPGGVKTRLAASVGNVAAAELYHAFLRTTLRRFTDPIYRSVLAYTPAERAREFQQLAGPAWELQRQSDGDLGQRMDHYFQNAVQSGPSHVILIGADSPNLPVTIIQQAFDALRHVSVVLGPSEDGGYYLIGGTELPPDVFTNIDWGSSQVWQQTIERLTASGLSYAVLPPWYDIDDRNDLDRLIRELAAVTVTDLHLTWLRDQIANVVGMLD